MTTIDSFLTHWKNPSTNCWQTVTVESGDGVEFDSTTFGGADYCGNATTLPKITVSAVPLGSVWTVFELELSAGQATAANDGGGGLNLTAVSWTYVRDSSGGSTGSWTVNDVPFAINLNGQRLSVSEFTVAAGILTFAPSTVVNAGDLIIIDRLGS